MDFNISLCMSFRGNLDLHLGVLPKQITFFCLVIRKHNFLLCCEFRMSFNSVIIFFLPTVLMQIVSSKNLQKVNLSAEPHDQENTDVTLLTTPGWGNVKTQWKIPKKPGSASPWRSNCTR